MTSIDVSGTASVATVPSADAVASPEVDARGAVRWRDVLSAYVSLTKPRIIELLLVTTVPVMFLAAGGIPPLTLVLCTLVGGCLAAASANVFNCVLDRDIDEQMRRTRRRPLPRHMVSPAADQGEEHQHQRRDPTSGQEHHRHGGDEQQLDDPGLGQRDVGREHIPPARRSPRTDLRQRDDIASHGAVGRRRPGHVDARHQGSLSRLLEATDPGVDRRSWVSLGPDPQILTSTGG